MQICCWFRAAMSVLILAVLLLLPLLRRRYGAALRYALWLVISVRLLIPLRLELPAAPVQIEVSRPAVLEQRVVRTAKRLRRKRRKMCRRGMRYGRQYSRLCRRTRRRGRGGFPRRRSYRGFGFSAHWPF